MNEMHENCYRSSLDFIFRAVKLNCTIDAQNCKKMFIDHSLIFLFFMQLDEIAQRDA